MEKIDRFRSSVRSEPRSPVERLKDTVSKMCLYTGSPRGSGSTSPQPSPRKRSSLPDVVDMVLVKSKTGATKKLDMGENNRSSSSVDVGLTDEDRSCSSGQIDTDIGNKIHHQETSDKPTDRLDADENIVQPADEDRKTLNIKTSLATSSGETDHQGLPPQAEQVAMVTHDLICPQIVERVHQAPFCCQHTRCPKTNTGTEGTDEAHEPNTQAPISVPGEDSSYTGDATSPGGVRPGGASSSLPVLAPNDSHTNYCITVTGWEGDGPSSSSSAPHSCHASNVPPVQTCEGSLEGGKTRYLNPPTHQSLREFSTNVKQVNSFELEEVRGCNTHMTEGKSPILTCSLTIILLLHELLHIAPTVILFLHNMFFLVLCFEVGHLSSRQSAICKTRKKQNEHPVIHQIDRYLSFQKRN